MSEQGYFEPVATVQGVGCVYTIARDERIADDSASCFTVFASSGPVNKIERETLTWLDAMAYVANDVESDLAELREDKTVRRLRTV